MLNVVEKMPFGNGNELKLPSKVCDIKENKQKQQQHTHNSKSDSPQTSNSSFFPINNRCVTYRVGSEANGVTMAQFHRLFPCSKRDQRLDWICFTNNKVKNVDGGVSASSDKDKDKDRDKVKDKDKDKDKGAAIKHNFPPSMNKQQGMMILAEWKAMEKSISSKNAKQKLADLAVRHNCLMGKWLVYACTPKQTELVWHCITDALSHGKLSSVVHTVKVSVLSESSIASKSKSNKKQVICVYTPDYRNVKECKGVAHMLLNLLRKRAGKAKIHINIGSLTLRYKPDIYTCLERDMQHNKVNYWKKFNMRPTLYEEVSQTSVSVSVKVKEKGQGQVSERE